MDDNPFSQFEMWFEELKSAGARDPYAFTLATADGEGRPSARVVYMRDFSPDGIVCYTNYHSHKGSDLSENPYFCANFFWQELERQVRFSGSVERLPSGESDAYFALRPRESQLGAWASDQSSEITNSKILTDKLEGFRKRFEGDKVPRPPHWGGYLLIPDTVEFWQGRDSRLHDRIVYSAQPNSQWKKSRLSP